MEPYRLTAWEAVKRMRSSDLTVEDYALSLLSRIEARNATVKAWAFLTPDDVLEQARRLDIVQPDQRGPLHGLAIGVKDVIYTKGTPSYTKQCLGNDVPVDAASVAILRAAGALIFGKTTTTEFAATTVGHPTTNAHDPSRTPGGSSSGSGAAVADFQIPIALGTQTGGSVIRPASFNGVYGFKPTWGAVSREGQKVYSLTLDTLGVFGRGVEDLRLLAGVLAIRDDAKSGPVFQGVKGARIGVVKGPVWHLAGAGTVAALEKGRELLSKHGAIVEEVELPSEFDNMPDWHAKIMAVDGRVSFLSDYRKDKWKKKMHVSLIAQVENVNAVSHAQELAAFDGVAMLRPRIDAIANRYDVLLAPSVVDEAPLGLESTGSAAFNGMWTALHTPVVNVPGFKGENGMPIGLSLVAARHHDEHLLTVAEAVGKVFEEEGGWKSAL
ncbi:amidase signature domain-containing protein [Aspergillus varians]